MFINKYKQTKLSVVVDILTEPHGYYNKPIVCWEPSFGKKAG